MPFSKNDPIVTKHGLAGTRLYTAWVNMKARCTNKNKKEYRHYGGRGILVCEEWEFNFIQFMEWALQNGYKDNLTIDRIDNDKGYYPLNCRWTTYQIQSINKRKQNNNKLGVRGVKELPSGNFIARITINGKSIYLGCFKTIDEASIARQKAEQKYHNKLFEKNGV